ncbi:MAG: NAD-dependent epimerase/dehydratase family protein [Limnobacter sp.]|nr:NAD-dependent epimerase/dehydratase family protein [Limnobacter sp.]
MVGRNVSEALLAHGHTVLTPARAQLDLADFAQTVHYLQTHKPDMVLHAAGRVGGIQANMAHPVEFLVENLDIARNTILAARQAGIPRLLNLGSSCMYPAQAPSPLHEDLVLTGALEPTNEGYALAKIMGMRLCQYIARSQSQFQYKTIIPCNLYGKYDKFNPAHSHLIPAILHKLHWAKMQGQATVEIWGDGTARREFMFAGDAAQALVRAAEHFDTLPAVMNLGVGRDHSVNRYYQAAAQVVDWQGGFVHDVSRPVGMQRKLVDVGRQAQWGWQPGFTLKQGLALTYAYYLTTEHATGPTP